MGLDMCLSAYNKKNNKICTIQWRKANQIRKWFVDTLDEFSDGDNLGTYEVTIDTIYDLLDDISIVLEDNSKAPEFLPTSSGFFFGSTEYDDGYFSQLKRTKKELEAMLKIENIENCHFKYSEWW